MQKNKICFFNTTKTWGGGEKWHFDMALYLHNKGYRVVFFVRQNSELYKRLQNTEIHIICINVGNLSFINIFKLSKLVNIFKKEKIDLLILNHSADLKIAGKSAKISKINNIIYRRGSAIPIKNTFFNRYIFKNIITHIIANSEETKNTINQKNKNMFPNQKIDVIYNGIDIKKYDSLPTTQLYKRIDNEIILGNAGRLEYQKNQKDLIYIAKILKSKNLNFKILIAGTGRLKNKLQELAIKENVSDKIVFLDFVENIKSFMQNIDIFLLTSFWEGFGFVLTEAMASSKPIVAYNISSNPEIIVENKTGFLIEANNFTKFAHKIETLTSNITLQKEFGKNGRKILEQKFDIEICRQNFIKFLKTIFH